MKMENYKQLFEQIIHKKVIQMEKTKKGITNDNYIMYINDGNYVLRIPKPFQFELDRKNEKVIIQRIAQEHLDVVTLYFNEQTGIKITKWVPSIPFNYHNKNHLILIIQQLKKLHSLSIEGILLFQPFIKFENYKKVHKLNLTFINEKKVLEKAKEIYQRYPLVLCHNDILFSNILVNETQLYLIDYEYAGLNISMFDVVSFISENDIEEISMQKEILNLYYCNLTDRIWHDFYWIHVFSDFFWAHWAYAMYQTYRQDIYLMIAKQKEKRYHRFINCISDYL